MSIIIRVRLLVVVVVTFLFTFLASCSPVLKLGKQPVALPPFVQLKDGTIIPAKEAGQEYEFGNGRVLADEQAFSRNKVRMYSNGEQTFVNLGKDQFGPKIAEGKIIVYSVTNATHYGYAYRDYSHLYIQDSGSSELFYMKYRALKPMIPTNTLAGKELSRFKNTRTAIRLTMLGGFACFISGTILAGNSIMKNNDEAKINTGLTMIFGGMGIIFGTTIPMFTNKMKMRRAMAIHNGVLSRHG
jgi:hypothetical protein